MGRTGHLDGSGDRWHDVCDVPETAEPPLLTREEVAGLIVLLMGIDWKLERIVEDLEIDNGGEEEDGSGRVAALALVVRAARGGRRVKVSD
jgi:hypothetical protein